MTRSHTSARAAGTRFERQIADALADALEDDRIDRRVKTGAADKGDIGGIRVHGQRLVIECKDTTRTDLAGWTAQARAEADNDGALAGVVVAKRRGIADPSRQWVHMELRDLIALITGRKPQ